MVKSTFKFLTFLTTVICIIMFASTGDEIGIKAAALAESGQCGNNVFWEYNASTGELVISGKGEMYDNYQGESPFDSSDIKNLRIIDGVTKIGSHSFLNCSSLKKIELADSILCIENYAFTSCKNLKSVSFSNNLNRIGMGAFLKCESLESVRISDSCKQLGTESFGVCRSLKKVTIGKGITSIPMAAFYLCDSLKNIDLPENVTSIQSYSFKECINLSKVTFSKKLTYIGVEAFASTAIKEVTIPRKVNIIEADAFISCKSLEKVVVLSDECDISMAAFYSISYSPPVTIYVNKDSKAYKYVKENPDKYTFKFIQHTYKSTVAKKATTSKNGKLKKVCKECGKETTSSIAKIKSVKLSKTSYVYDGKEKKPTVTINDSNDKKLTLNTDYTVTYSGKRIAVGTYKVTVKFKGKYSGSKSLEFKIVIGKVSGIKSTINGKDVKISWSKVAGATGYQVLEYDKAKKKYKELGKFGKNSITNSRSKQKITLKIRAYYIDKSGKTHYGSYSDPTSIKI